MAATAHVMSLDPDLGCACGNPLKTPSERREGECRACQRRGDTPRPTEAFTVAERSLVQAMHQLMPSSELLKLINERRTADRPTATPYTIDHLQEEIERLAKPSAGADFGGLRAVLAEARRTGLIDRMTPTLLHDFAVVFRLTTAQTTHLKDVVSHAREDV